MKNKKHFRKIGIIAFVLLAIAGIIFWIYSRMKQGKNNAVLLGNDTGTVTIDSLKGHWREEMKLIKSGYALIIFFDIPVLTDQIRINEDGSPYLGAKSEQRKIGNTLSDVFLRYSITEPAADLTLLNIDFAHFTGAENYYYRCSFNPNSIINVQSNPDNGLKY